MLFLYLFISIQITYSSQDHNVNLLDHCSVPRQETAFSALPLLTWCQEEHPPLQHCVRFLREH